MSDNYILLKEYISGKRSISISNISTSFSLDNGIVIPIIKTLESEGLIRVVNSSCTLDCSSCSTCGDIPESKYLDTTIIVSLVYSNRDNI